MDTRHTIRSLRSRPEAVLFDWDNTIIDHDKHTAHIVADLARTYGKAPHASPEEIIIDWGIDKQQCCDKHFSGMKHSEITRVFHAMVDEMVAQDVPLKSGALDVLNTMRAKGIRMSIVSNKPEKQLKHEVELLGLSDYFEVIRGDRYDGTPLKPDPKPLIETVNSMDLPLHNLWFVGDMLDDIGAARSDGFQRFLIGTRHRDKVQSLSYGADPAGKIIYLDSIALLDDFAKAIPEKTERSL